ncbi:MAG: hypothetical protein RBU21_02835 [FCB group bacterium]|nr:hypothetical protein [FCB group bacterium]
MDRLYDLAVQDMRLWRALSAALSHEAAYPALRTLQSGPKFLREILEAVHLYLPDVLPDSLRRYVLPALHQCGLVAREPQAQGRPFRWYLQPPAAAVLDLLYGPVFDHVKQCAPGLMLPMTDPDDPAPPPVDWSAHLPPCWPTDTATVTATVTATDTATVT